MNIEPTTCDFCVATISNYSKFARCQQGHFLCETCVQGSRQPSFGRQANTCPKCYKPLMSQEAYLSQPSLEKQIMRAAGKMQIKWSLYLFRSPDLVLVILAWGFSLIFLISAGRNASFFFNVLEWIVGSFLVAIAPVLTLMFIRKKKSGLGMIAGWIAAWRGDWRPVWIIVGIASVLFLMHLTMERTPIR